MQRAVRCPVVERHAARSSHVAWHVPDARARAVRAFKPGFAQRVKRRIYIQQVTSDAHTHAPHRARMTPHRTAPHTRAPQGRTVSFANTVIILTSNLGAATLLEHGCTPAAKEAVLDTVRRHFRPEFLNRLGARPPAAARGEGIMHHAFTHTHTCTQCTHARTCVYTRATTHAHKHAHTPRNTHAHTRMRARARTCNRRHRRV